jgi:hypothetical protein
MVEGLVATAILGIVGGAIAELIKVATAFKSGTPPSANQWIASIIFALLGAAVVLEGTGQRTYLEVAQLGAAFPLFFSGLVAAATQTPANNRAGTRSVTDYISFRM